MQLSLWDISKLPTSCDTELQPAATAMLPAGEVQTHVAFHPNDPSDLVTNGVRRVLFWQQHPAGQQLSCYSPPFRSSDFQQSVGGFVASTFVPGTSQVICCCGAGRGYVPRTRLACA